MKFLNRNARRLVLAVSFSGITFHMYWLPFHPWTLGMVRPWFMLQGLIPYRDFVWIRMPTYLFVLTGWYSIFGVSPDAYRAFIMAIIMVTMVLLYAIKKSCVPVVLYALWFPPLFFNTEVGEMLIGLYVVVFVYLFVRFFENNTDTFMLFAAGVVTGLMIMTKQSTACVSFIAITVLFFNMRRRNERLPFFVKQVALYGLGSIVVPVMLIIYFAYHYALYDAYYFTVEFLLSSYTSAPVMKGNGIILAGSLLALIVPVVFPGMKTTWHLLNISIGGLTLSLLPLLYPSFLSYRAYPLFPLVILASSMLIIQWQITTILSRKVLILLSVAMFVFGTR